MTSIADLKRQKRVLKSRLIVAETKRRPIRDENAFRFGSMKFQIFKSSANPKSLSLSLSQAVRRFKLQFNILSARRCVRVR